MTRKTLAIGPELPDFGSWNWLGRDLLAALSGPFETRAFRDEAPDADLVLFLKFLPPADALKRIARRSRVVFAPVDVYGSAAEIDGDAGRLSECGLVVSHAPRLDRYFRPYAPLASLPHHVKYLSEIAEARPADGPVLWVGVRGNLPPLARWWKSRRPPYPLVILTDLKPGESPAPAPASLGFGPDQDVRVEPWSPERHLAWQARCRGALDVKAGDFRARHKPAAKACDYLASGVPLALERDSSSAEYLRELGFDAAGLDDPRWLSEGYLRETVAFGRELRERFSLPNVARQWERLLTDLLERPPRLRGSSTASVAAAGPADPAPIPAPRPRRIAIVSLLFNWPSTGGGTVHTAELARFLHRDGYAVRHLSFRFDPWGLGQVREPVDWPLRELHLTEQEWDAATIQRTLRQALDEFGPDAVVVTDSWSMKPVLAEACRGYPVYLRLAAQECLCPLTNVRLLGVDPPVSCPKQQLATPDACRACVAGNGRFSGSLHQAERQLAGFGTPEYADLLRRSFAEAAGVLVVNPLIAEACKPHARAVHVIPSGFDPSRFPWDDYFDRGIDSGASSADRGPSRIVFAGLVREPMKGFRVLLEACRMLWLSRQDFRLVVTDEPGDLSDPFLESVGWQTQANLPRLLRDAAVVACPTIAEEALGRTAVEAMGAWRPVVASRIGGLPFAVPDGAAGLLAEPGDASDLARQLARLLDDPALRERLGRAGRERFDRHYAWPAVLGRHYRPLFAPLPEARP